MARQLFQLIGEIGVDGLKAVQDGLTDVDKRAMKVSKQFTKMSRNVTRFGMSVTKNVTVPLVAAGIAVKGFVDEASDLGETASKVGALFGESAKDIDKWADSSAGAIGQSKKEAMDAAGTFAIFGKSAKLAGGELVDFSTEFVELASDLASFFNTKPEEAVTAIGAAFRGESEPIRRYGVLMNEASLKQIALKNGIIDTVDNALTPQQKVLAASKLILEQTADAQGDFQRTSEGMANQSRILAAEWKNASAELGQAFLPVALEFVGLLREKGVPLLKRFVGWFKSLEPELVKNGVALAAVLAVVGPLIIGIGKMIGAFKVLAPAIAVVNAALLANPFALAVAGVVALTGAIYGAVKAYEKVQEEHRKFTIQTAEQAQIDSFISSVDLLTKKIMQYGNTLNDPKKAQELLGKEIEEATKKARALGFVIEGNLVKKMEKLNEVSNGLKGTVFDLEKGLVKAKKGQDKLGESTEKLKGKTKTLSDFQKDWILKTLNQQLRMTESIENQAEIRLQILEMEKQEAIQNAKEKGENVTSILKYYSNQELLITKEKQDKLDKINQEKLSFEKEWQAKLAESNISIANTLQERTDLRLSMLEAEKVEALKKAEEMNVSKNAILLFYENEAVRIRKESFDEVTAFEDMYQKSYEEKSLSRIELLRKERDEALLIADELGAEKETIRQYYQDLETEAVTQNVQNQVQIWADAVNTTLNLFKMANDNKIALIDKELAKNKQAIQTSTMNEAEKTAAIIKLEKKAEAEKLKLKQKAAKQEKAGAIFGALVNTALAVSSALTMKPPPLGIAMGVIMGVLGAAQVALIASQPLPFAKGGLVKSGSGGVTGLVGEGKEDEVIFPLQTGVIAMADALIDRFRDIEFKNTSDEVGAGAAAVVGAPGGSSVTYQTHLHVGVLVADEAGLKELENKLLPIRNEEAFRRGEAVSG